jgi:hypothetical protein
VECTYGSRSHHPYRLFLFSFMACLVLWERRLFNPHRRDLGLVSEEHRTGKISDSRIMTLI